MLEKLSKWIFVGGPICWIIINFLKNSDNTSNLFALWIISGIILILHYYIANFIYVSETKDQSVIKTEETIRDIALPRPNGKRLAQAFQSRKIGNIPPSYPTGWFHVCYSHELKPGDIKYVQYLGEHLALFRTKSGIPSILDAYCPHLGANIAIGGEVVGESIKCPFHGWEFDKEGLCTNIPYCDNIPSNAKTTAWQVIERNGCIFVWFDLDKNDPTYEVPILPQVQNHSMIFHASQESHVEAHIQEIPENGSDSAHFGVLHVEFRLLKLLKWLFAHEWECSAWTACQSPNSHKATFRIGHRLKCFNRTVPFSSIEVEIVQIGPSLVVLEVSHALFGDFIITETVTPIAPLFQRITHGIYGKNNPFSRAVGISFLAVFTEMFTRDMMIWRNKTYKHQPILVKNDGNINAFRRWYRQFYPKNNTNKNVLPTDRSVDSKISLSPEKCIERTLLPVSSETW